jgi:hypothetical protein
MKQILKITPMEKLSENFFNITPATNFVPEWYRKSNTNFPDSNTELIINSPDITTSTYKKCTPFFDALTFGYMVHLSADVEVTRKDDGMPFLMWRTGRTIITEHTSNQWDGFPCPEGYSPFIYKWHNQFAINVPKNYSLLFTSPINRFDLPFITITGVVDCDIYNGTVHFPFFIKNNFSGIIKMGTPITQIIPIKRESWKTNYGTYDEDRQAIWSEKFLSTIKRSYKNNYWQRKEYK